MTMALRMRGFESSDNSSRRSTSSLQSKPSAISITEHSSDSDSIITEPAPQKVETDSLTKNKAQRRKPSKKSKENFENSDKHLVIDEEALRAVQVRTWYSLKDEFPPKTQQALFSATVDDLLRKEPNEIDDWLEKVEREVPGDQKIGGHEKDDDKKPESNIEGMEREVEVLTWFALRDQFHSSQQILFELSAEERLQQDPDVINLWLGQVKAAFDENQRQRSQLSTEQDVTAPYYGELINPQEGDSDSSDESMAIEIQVRSWFALQEEFHAFDESLFQVSAEERLLQPPQVIAAWLQEVESEWGLYEEYPTQDDAAVSFDKDDDTTSLSVENSVEVRTWFSLQEEYGALDKSLFKLSLEERLQEHPDQVDTWLQQVQAAWDRYEKNNTSRASVATDDGASSAIIVASHVRALEAVNVNAIEVRTWYSLQKEFSALDDDLFEVPVDARLQQTPLEVNSWLKQVERAWEQYTKQSTKKKSKPPVLNGVAAIRASKRQAPNSDSKSIASASSGSTSSRRSPPKQSSRSIFKRLSMTPSRTSMNESSRDSEKAASKLSPRAAAKAEAKAAKSGDSVVDIELLEIEIQTWFNLQEEYGVLDNALFELPAEERLKQNKDQVQMWLQQVQSQWDQHQKSRVGGLPRCDSDDDDD